MIRIVRLACGLSLAATVALPACSSSDGGGPGPGNTASAFSSGLPQGQSFVSVTDADIGKLCEAWANYVIGPQRDPFCKTRAWGAATAAVGNFEAMGCGPTPGGSDCVMTDADLQAACAAAQTKCEGQVPFEDVVSHCDFQKPAPGCTATVGEFEACIAEYFVIMEESYSDFSSCSSVTVADVKRLMGAPPTTPGGNYSACKTFQGKCPGAFGEGGVSVSPVCGNGVLDPGEQCDGANLDGETCTSVTGGSLPNGELVCNRACMFDGSVCTAP